jgi:hypothetical protein
MDTWVHREGQRDTGMVSYDPEPLVLLSRTYEPPDEFQSSLWEFYLLLKIRVRPVPWASWQWKRVGVLDVWSPREPRIHLGEYHAPLGSGMEEWHVRIHGGTSAGASARPNERWTFLVWYQDGLGHTWYDDNNGKLFVVPIR